MTSPSQAHVVVLGSSFAGLTTARFIHALAGSGVRISVIDRSPYLTFVPNIPMEVFADRDPLVTMHMETVRFHDHDGSQFVNAEVTSIDPDARTVTFTPSDRAGSAPESMTYDFLVVAVGCRLAYDRIEGFGQFGDTVSSSYYGNKLRRKLTESYRGGPIAIGVVAGSVAGGRVPPRIGGGGEISSWWNPVSIMVGVFSVVVCAYLAAVHLTADARREGDGTLVAYFRARALVAGIAAGAVAGIGLILLHRDAPVLAHGLGHRAIALVILSGVAGIAAFVLLFASRFLLARVAAALAVTAVVWAWAVAQYPHLLGPGLTISMAAATSSVLKATFISLVVGAVLLVPSLVWLYVLFQRPPPEQFAGQPQGVCTDQREGTHQ